MANTVIQLKKSATPGSSPTSLANGEIGINYADGVIYYKASNGSIASISSGTPSFGTINAAGTLLIADAVNDVLDIRSGDNITITGDAINDRLTIAASLTPANNWANTKLSNGSVTLAGALTTTGSIYANGVVYVTPVGGQEGGEIKLQATGTNTNWNMDSYQNNFRVFAESGTTVSNVNFFHAVGGGSIRMGVNKADPAYTVDVSGDVNITGTYRVNGSPFTGDLTPANNWANTINTAIQTQFAAVNNYSVFVGASANNWANTKLANTSGVSFAGNLYFPTGSIGINTTTPKALLDVKPLSTSNTFSMVLSSGQITNGFGSLRYTTSYAHNDLLLGNFQDAAGYSQTAISFGYTGDSSRKLHIGSANSGTFDSNASFIPAVTVTSGGKVGIGTASPSAKLDVKDSDGTGLYIGTSSVNYYDANVHVFRSTLQTERMRIDNAGNIGIGTTAPAYRLDVAGSANISLPTLLVAGQNVLSLISTVGASGNNWANTINTAIQTQFAAVNNYSVFVGASANNWANTKLANTSDVSFAGNLYFPTGNVGIGTTSPGAKLHVVGDAYILTNLKNNSIMDLGGASKFSWSTGSGQPINYYGALYGNGTESGLAPWDSVIGRGSHILGDGISSDYLAFNPPSTAEIYDGSTWTSTTVPNDLFQGKHHGIWNGFTLGTSYSAVRFTWSGSFYWYTNSLMISHSTQSNIMYATIEYSTDGGNTWSTYATTQTFSSWPGYTLHHIVNSINASANRLRITITRSGASSGNACIIGQISLLAGYGLTGKRLFNWDYQRRLSFGSSANGGGADLSPFADISIGNGSSVTNYQGAPFGIALPTGSGSWIELVENTTYGTSFRISKDSSTGIVLNSNVRDIGFKADGYGTTISGSQVVLKTSGNVGIGTTSPTSNLHVIGTANISSATLIVAGQNVLSLISTVGASGNNWANTINTAIQTQFAAVNNYTISVGASSNNWANTINTALQTRDTAGNNFTISVGAASNNWANSVNTYSDSTYFKKTGGMVSGDVQVTGNLNVMGNVTFTNTNSVVVSDPLLYLAGNNYTSDIVDIGIIANYVNSTFANVHTGVFRDATSKEWFVFEGYSQEPVGNHIDTNGNNFTISVLNATLRTSNLILGGANAITTIVNNAAGANGWANNINTAIQTQFPAVNNYTISVGAAANSFSGAMANSVNIAHYVYANATGTGANNFAGLLSNNSNNWANTKVSSVTGTSGRITSSGGTTPAIDLATSGVTAQTASGGISSITVDTYGRITGIVGSAGYITSGLANTSGVSFNGNLFFPTGNVGIGTSAPSAKLQISNAGSFTAIRATNTTDSVQFDAIASSTAVAIGAATSHPLILNTGNTERMRITSAGNVGIGTTSPASKLHIDSTATLINDDTVRFQYDNGTAAIRLIGASASPQSIYFGTSADNKLGRFVFDNSNQAFYFTSNASEHLRITNTGNVGIGTTTPAYKLQVNGSFAANTKSFVIDHPTKPDMKLQHGSLEGPENGVYVRGKIHGYVIELPDYWTGLVDEDTITVQLTAIGESQSLYVVEVNDNKVIICGENGSMPYCYYTIYGERKDVGKLIVEY